MSPTESCIAPLVRDERWDQNAVIRAAKERRKLVYKLYHQDDKTVREIGALLNISHQRVSQILAKAKPNG